MYCMYVYIHVQVLMIGESGVGKSTLVGRLCEDRFMPEHRQYTLGMYMYTHTHSHTHIHTYTHAYTHTRAPPVYSRYVHTHTLTHIHTYTHAYTHQSTATILSVCTHTHQNTASTSTYVYGRRDICYNLAQSMLESKSLTVLHIP